MVQPLISPVEAEVTAEFSPFQFAKKVEKVIEEYVRPSLKMDGGNIEVMDIKGTIVYCSLQGACAGCAGASQTMKMMVERVLKDQVDERIRVIEV
ncbi:MAG: NifU family protein [Anaerolineae bacterium]